ncbi:UNVERIFIED_CONTAM: Homeobox-DDT domain protein RLT1 [Sesamum radiatum]|uniref:Homeobox-DDT domain protein RLT1 n=1 Tax=Sesamum radiatum TaxID=300843 RepID=A0AAW2V905_SESRA
MCDDSLTNRFFLEVPAEQQDRYRSSYDTQLYGQYDVKHIKASSAGPHEAVESKIRADTYGHVAPAYLYDAPVDGPTTKSLSNMHGDVHVAREHGVEGQAKSMDVYSQPGRQMQFSVSPRNTDFMTHNEVNLHMERKRKSDEARIAREVQAHEKKIQKELEKQDLLRRKREEQMRKEMETQDRERRKEEQRMIREQQRQEEKFQREMERREKFMQKELLQLCLNINSVQLRMPFAIQRWINSEENVGNLLMVWKFCVTFADVLGLWPFMLDEFIQAFHEYVSFGTHLEFPI